MIKLRPWIGFALLLTRFHWLNALYAAVLSTPILTTLLLRCLELRYRGFARLPWRTGLRLYGWTAAFVISRSVLLYTIEGWRGRRALTSLQESVTRSNRSLDVTTLAPPVIPDDENLCALPLLSSLLQGNEQASLVRGDFWDLAPSRELDQLRSIKLPDRPPKLRPPWRANEPTNFKFWLRLFERQAIQVSLLTGAPSAPESVLAVLKPFEGTINELHEAARNRPQSRWNLNYGHGWLASAFTGMRDNVLAELVAVIALRSSAHLAKGDSKVAASDFKLGMRLVESVRSEPSIYTQLTRVDWLFVLFQPLWEGLAHQAWSSPDVKEIQRQLEKIDLIEQAKRLR